jgi:hypothetical protein
MTTKAYQKLINDTVNGLPPEILAEILDFALFLRKRTMQPELFEEEMQHALLRSHAKRFRQKQETHLEKEFEHYKKLFTEE